MSCNTCVCFILASMLSFRDIEMRYVLFKNRLCLVFPKKIPLLSVGKETFQSRKFAGIVRRMKILACLRHDGHFLFTSKSCIAWTIICVDYLQHDSCSQWKFVLLIGAMSNFNFSCSRLLVTPIPTQSLNFILLKSAFQAIKMERVIAERNVGCFRYLTF